MNTPILKEALRKIVNETNELLKLENYKELIDKIVKNIGRINKLAEKLELKVYLRINKLVLI